MATINLIDPTQSNLTGNTDYQNLFIYVDMTAERKGFTTYNNDTNYVNSSELKSVNLLGYNSSKKFTTDYSTIYNDKNIYEGFGIKSISIETNASYVPKITVDFVDIKGMSFFNNPNDSPYSVLFDFPPPIFTMKVKGYYGKTLEYKLHMLRHNTRFNADDGNYYITAEFVGNTFAPLTDILFQNVLMVSKLEDTDVTPDTKKGVNTLADLVTKSKTIKNEVIDNLTNNSEYIEFNKLSDNLTIKRDAIKNKIELNENTAIIKLYKSRLSNNILTDSDKYELIKNSVSLNDLIIDNDIEYYIVNYQNNFTTTRFVLNDIYNNLFNAFNVEIGQIIDNKPSLSIYLFGNNYEININIKDNISSPINYTNITRNIDIVYSDLTKLENEYTDKYKTIEEETKNIVTTQLGFEPTIYRVMEIISNDIDAWIDELAKVYNNSVDHIKDNISKIKREYSSDISKIYPFPDFIENKKKSFPNKLPLSELPEVKFTNEFIDKFINYKKNIRNEEFTQSKNLVGDNNINIWFPINPLDSSYRYIGNINPYIGLTTIDQIFAVLFSRLYIYNFYTHDRGLNYIDYFFKNEKNVILFSITDKKLLSAFNNKLKDINNINNLKLNYNFINIYINKILGNLNIDTTKHKAIDLSYNKKNKLKDNISIDLSFDGDYYSQLKTKEINENEIGLTINEENNIIYYDGNSLITSFVSAIDDTEKFNSVINKSITTGLKLNYVTPNDRQKRIKKDLQINDIIYDYYINYNNPSIEKKIYGILNLIYVPNLKIIDEILFKIPIISEIPLLTKIYISSLVYALNSDDNTFNIDENYLSVDEKNLINESNKDFIYNIYNINYPIPVLKRYFRNNYINYRSIIVNKLNNLSDDDRNEYINYYKKFVKTNGSILINFINTLLIDGKFKNDYKDININDIIFLSEKEIIINTSNYTYTDKSIYNDLFTENIINKNINELLISNLFKPKFNTFIKTLENKISNRIDTLEESNDINNNLQEVRIETYYSFKNFVDRWLVNNESNNVSRNTVFSLEGEETPFINLFQFIDRASNPTVARNSIIDISILQEFENDYSVNMLTVIGKLLNENGFEFYPLQNFIDFKDQWTSDQIFTPQITEIDKALRSPKFTCMYIGGTSKYLDSEFNSNTTFKNDGIKNIDVDAPDFNEDGSNAFGFRVRFGDGKQSIFSKIEVSTEEVQPTNESLKSLSLIIDGGNKNTIPTTQNLFSTYEQRSYMCKITMFGDAMIQPTQYFMLENIPMFGGLYLILKVNHSIDGETNSMMTTFEGIRLPKEPRPFITNPFDVYAKNLLDKNLLDPLTRNNNGPETSRNLEKKDRTIYLVAGHHNNDTGATYIINGEQIIERDLTISLRDSLKNEAEKRNLIIEIDDDKDTLSQVVNKINNQIQSNDIVFDIHFNSFDEPSANGIEVFIKDSTNADTINLAKDVVDVLNKSLSLNIRKSNNPKLPVGVKTQQESQYRNLRIFDINATVILIEVCFISNSNDYRIYKDNKTLLVKNLIDYLEKISINENDKKIESVQTYTILNTLRYDNLNRTSPYLIPSEKIDTFNSFINNFKFTKIFEKEEYTANNLNQVYVNNLNLYKANIKSQIELTANKYKIDALFLAGIIYIESRFNPLSVSKGSAIGLGQFTLNGAMPEVLGYMNGNRTTNTNIYKFSTSTNSFILTSTTYGDILNILFDNEPISKLIFSFDKFRTTLEKERLKQILVKNVFNNPFIMIEMVGIYMKRLESYSNTSGNKNAGILSLNYNVGNHGLTNYTGNKPYFDHIINFYNNTKIEDIKNKLVGKIPNEGIKYPERLINEYLIKFISIDGGKSNLFT